MSIEMPCIYFSDGKCKKFSEPGYISYCAYAPCGYEKPSNADRIRAMTDEKLADFESTLGCHPAATKETCIGVDRCAECWLDWLKQGEVVAEKCGFEP